jgi:hypothetical protein
VRLRLAKRRHHPGYHQPLSDGKCAQIDRHEIGWRHEIDIGLGQPAMAGELHAIVFLSHHRDAITAVEDAAQIPRAGLTGWLSTPGLQDGGGGAHGAVAEALPAGRVLLGRWGGQIAALDMQLAGACIAIGQGCVPGATPSTLRGRFSRLGDAQRDGRVALELTQHRRRQARLGADLDPDVPEHGSAPQHRDFTRRRGFFGVAGERCACR